MITAGLYFLYVVTFLSGITVFARGDSSPKGEVLKVIPIQVQAISAAEIRNVEVVATLNFLKAEIYDPSNLRIFDESNTTRRSSAKVLDCYGDGSVRRAQISFRVETVTPKRKLFLCRYDAVVKKPHDHTNENAVTADSVQNAEIMIWTGNIGALMNLAPWAPLPMPEWEQNPQPEWWKNVRVSFSPEVDQTNLPKLIDYVDASYTEHGLAREAIKLYYCIYSKAKSEDLKSALRSVYEIARLYEVFLHDFVRAFKWYKWCNDAYVAEAEAAQQNFIASSFGMIRCYEGLGYEDKALMLYSSLVRQILADSSDYGRLMLPQIYVRLGDIHRRHQRQHQATWFYQRCVQVVKSFAEDVPYAYKYPLSAAETALKEMRYGSIDLTKIKDGDYQGTGLGYNSLIRVKAEVKKGRLSKLLLLQFNDKKPQDAYDIIPKRILAQQRLDVDVVTGATVTSKAIIQAVKDAFYSEHEKDVHQ